MGSKGAIELPHDAFIPQQKDPVFTQRGTDEEVGEVHSTPGVDEYQLIGEHFCEAVSGETQLTLSPEQSVCNMRALDGLAQAAHSGRTLALPGHH